MSEKTIGERIAAGEIGPDSPATRSELEKCWQYTGRLADKIEDLRGELDDARARIRELERLRELDEDYQREMSERNG